MKQETRSQTNLDTQVLSDFIYDLNIARRQLALYPVGHPRIVNSSRTVVSSLKKLCRFRSEITLGIAPDAMFVEGNRLDETNPTYRDLAGFFSAFAIVSVTFNSALTPEELLSFIYLISANKPYFEQSSGLATLLERNNIRDISVIPVDYSRFEIGLQVNTSDKDHIWNDFLTGLLSRKTERTNDTGESAGSLRPMQAAHFLNHAQENGLAESQNYGQLIGSFISELQNQSQKNKTDFGEQLGALVKNLNPELKQIFFNSTFQVLDQNPHMATALPPSLAQDLMAESFELQNREQHNSSARLVDLLGQFSPTTQSKTRHTTSGTTTDPDDDMLKARVEVLLLEDSHDEYLPTDYQATLSKILTGEVTGDLDHKTAQHLKSNLEKQSVERQCCSIIFNMLNNRVDAEIEDLIQENLAELSHFFLDTGDFTSLQDIFVCWSSYLYSDHSNARFLDEKVIAEQTRTSFMNEVLDSVELWGKDKYDEICSYIQEIGEPYAELLIERLSVDEQMSRRKTWMKLLVALGRKGHQIILSALEDQRWYLVRNLLIVLGQQRNAIPTKAVYQLTSHPHPKVRQEALRILFRHNPATANRILLKELSCGDRGALSAAIQLAECSQDAKVLHQLHQLLQTDLEQDEDLNIKRILLDTLAHHGRPDTIPILAGLLKRKGFIRSRRQKSFQKEIINHLGAFPRHTSEPLLNAIIKGRDRTQSQLAKIQLDSYCDREVS